MQKRLPRVAKDVVCLLPFLAMFAGCFGGGPTHPDLVEVTGVVTIQGVPAKDVSVVFQPEAGGNASRGTTEEDGSYRLMYDRRSPGALPGAHQIRFLSMATDATGATLPAKYRGPETGISVEVSLDGPNEFNFDLNGK